MCVEDKTRMENATTRLSLDPEYVSCLQLFWAVLLRGPEQRQWILGGSLLRACQLLGS